MRQLAYWEQSQNAPDFADEGIDNWRGLVEDQAGMNFPEKLNRWPKAPQLTSVRIFLALTVALGADGLQLLLNGPGWFGPDQIIDVVTMIVLSRVIGFHVLLLPTFVVELVPVVDDLPTWTACAAAVILLRKRDQRGAAPPVPKPPERPVIDV